MRTLRPSILFAASTLCVLNAFAATTVTERDGDVVSADGSVRTGAKSRAELRDDAGTLVRAGSHADVKVSGREVTVTSGSVLVNAPEGDGTVVHTTSGDLKFDGGTAIVTVGADGATKVHVLAGEAEFTSSQGESASLTAGQMTLTAPGGAGELPVTDFDLGRLAKSSRLVTGFSDALPASSMIDGAAKDQQVRIESGKLHQTGLVVVSAGRESGFRVAPSVVIGASVNSLASRVLRNTQPVVYTTSNPNYVILAGANIAGGSALLNLVNGNVITAAGTTGNISNGGVVTSVNSGTLQLGGAGGTLAYNSGATTLGAGSANLIVNGSNAFAGTGTLTVAAGTLIVANNLTFNPNTVTVGTGATVLFNGTPASGLVINGTDALPVLTIGTGSGDITLANQTISANAVSITAAGNLTLTGGTITAKAGDIGIGASNTSATITITNTAFTTLEALRAIKFGADGKTPDTLAINGATFSGNGSASISAEAKTLNLQNVAFPAQSVVTLNSRDGVLNIGDSQVGAVNFISGVTYGGADLTTAGGINAHVNAPNGITKQGAAFTGATGNAAGEVTIGKIAVH